MLVGAITVRPLLLFGTGTCQVWCSFWLALKAVCTLGPALKVVGCGVGLVTWPFDCCVFGTSRGILLVCLVGVPGLIL